MTGALVCHPEPERPIRAEDWEGLATGTYRRPVRAIDESAPETGDLMRYFCTEARIIFDLYVAQRITACFPRVDSAKPSPSLPLFSASASNASRSPHGSTNPLSAA